MVFVGESSERAGLSDAVCVERLAGFLKNLGDAGGCEAVADAEIRKALDFRRQTLAAPIVNSPVAGV